MKNEIPLLEFDTEQTAVINTVGASRNSDLFSRHYIDEYALTLCPEAVIKLQNS